MATDLFQSTLPVKGATRGDYTLRRVPAISIHAPCEGSDIRARLQRDRIGISIHAPCEGSDFAVLLLYLLGDVFQSTLPVKGATVRAGNLSAR